MKYNNKTQTARQKYLQRQLLSEKEQKCIDKDLSGNDFRFFMSADTSFILPDQYRAESTYRLIEKRMNPDGLARHRTLIQYIGYAAAVMILAFLSTILYNNYIKQPRIVYATTSYGEKKEVILPDGSIVILNSMSSIAYPEKMNRQTREVQLQGEAYFEVAKNAHQAFIVKINNMEVKVLGTRFNIHAYENQDYIATTLFEGIVSVSAHGQSAYKLKPGEQAIYRKESEKFETREIKDINDEDAWRHNVLAFDNRTLSEILNTLSREYNVTFEMDNEELKRLKITARFRSEESVDKALEILGESAAFTHTRHGNTYKITTQK